MTGTSLALSTAIVLVGLVPGMGRAQTRAEAAAPRRGDEIFRTGCLNCHGPDGRGAPRSTVGFDVELPDFTDCAFASPEDDADWHAIIANGGAVRRFDRMMPAFKDALTSEEISNVIDYLRGFCRDKSWPLGNLNLPRALVTEKAFPENETIITTTYESRKSVSNVVVYEHRVGARGQYEVVVPFDLQKRQGETWSRGLGDVAAAFKRVLFDDVRAGSILSAGGEVTFPTGKESSGLGSGATILEPFLALSQILPVEGVLHVHAGLERSLNHARANDETFVRAAIGRSFAQPHGGRIWSPMVEWLGTRELVKGEHMRWDVLPELQVALSRRQHILINVGLQMPVNERQGRNRKLLFYFLWDWFDGGLFEGW